ncbi:hypothetical protein Lepto7375DRAFT_3884 [Leptolyngbya sp. PCC 7375]|nr:hypothetical protein Lepto7375DRAFT_3884 [Leptolyngbya sp. PCC 7375]
MASGIPGLAKGTAPTKAQPLPRYTSKEGVHCELGLLNSDLVYALIDHQTIA